MLGDAQPAYLFQCGDEELFAVSPDKAGRNIPRSSCTQGWILRQEFKLGTFFEASATRATTSGAQVAEGSVATRHVTVANRALPSHVDRVVPVFRMSPSQSQ